MSNLGGYQKITTWAKICHGPYIMLVIIFTSGYVILRSIEEGVKSLFRKIRDKTKSNVIDDTEYVVSKDIVINNKMTITSGSHFRIVSIDGDAAIVEFESVADNPYVVSISVLCDSSDYRVNET